MKNMILILLIFIFVAPLQAQKKVYPRIVGDIGVGISAQVEGALGEFADFAGTGLGLSGFVEYAFTPRWVTNLTFSGQGFSGTAPDTLILQREVFFKDDLTASNRVNSFFVGTRLYSHSKGKIQLFIGGRLGLERISIKLENTDDLEGVTTVVSEEKKFRLGLSPEIGVRYNNIWDIAALYSAFSDGSYWGIKAGVFLPLRKW